jgi:hypothetical protein
MNTDETQIEKTRAGDFAFLSVKICGHLRPNKNAQS